MNEEAVKAIDMKELKEAIKALNETGEVDPKIKIVGTKKETLIDLFIEGVETLSDDGIDMPAVVIEFYNSLPEDEEGTVEEPDETKPETEPEKKEKPKAKKKAAKKTPAKKEKPKAEKKPKSDPVQRKETKRDEFGFTVGCQSNLFAKAIKRKAMTMADVKKLDWNEKSRTFYDVFNDLVEKGLAVKDEKTNKMKIVKK